MAVLCTDQDWMRVPIAETASESSYTFARAEEPRVWVLHWRH